MSWHKEAADRAEFTEVRQAMPHARAASVFSYTSRSSWEKRTKRILSETEKKPVTFEKITWRTNDYFWYRRTVSEGTKGPVPYEFMDRGLFCVKIDGLSGRFG